MTPAEENRQKEKRQTQIDGHDENSDGLGEKKEQDSNRTLEEIEP